MLESLKGLRNLLPEQLNKCECSSRDAHEERGKIDNFIISVENELVFKERVKPNYFN